MIKVVVGGQKGLFVYPHSYSDTYTANSRSYAPNLGLIAGWLIYLFFFYNLLTCCREGEVNRSMIKEFSLPYFREVKSSWHCVSLLSNRLPYQEPSKSWIKTMRALCLCLRRSAIQSSCTCSFLPCSFFPSRVSTFGFDSHRIPSLHGIIGIRRIGPSLAR